MTSKQCAIAALCSLAGCVFAPLRAYTQSAAATPEEEQKAVAAATKLTDDAKGPFHLKMSFQLFTVDGKPSEAGTLEEWWAPGRSRVMIVSPTVHESQPDGQRAALTRESYLVHGLLEQVLQPVPVDPAEINTVNTKAMRGKLADEDKKFGNLTLHCLVMKYSNEFATGGRPADALCMEPGTNNLRIRTGGAYSVTRNKIGRFHNTSVPIELTLTSSVGQNEIKGTVVEMNSIPATDAHLPEAPKATTPPDVYLASGVMAGMKLEGKVPEYPVMAREGHIMGSVVLAAHITTAGAIADMIVVSSPDNLLTDSAMAAVKTWKYKPYLLNGSPTDVDTTIIVNFSLNQR